MVKEENIIPRELVEDEDILDVLHELVIDADIFALCPSCKMPFAVEEYESAHCSKCGDIAFEDIVYIYKENDETVLN